MTRGDGVPINTSAVERMNEDETFGGMLRRLREHAGLSQDAVGLAIAVHGADRVTASAVGQWESGSTKRPSYKNVRALAHLFDAPELLGAAGYADDDEFETMREQLAQLRDEVGDLKRMLLDLIDRLPRG